MNESAERFRRFGKVIIRLCLLAMAGWATLAILFSNLPGFLRPWIAGIFGIVSLAALVGRYGNRRARLGFLAAFSAVLVWWLFMPPSNSRNWQPDVALLPWADIRGTRVTIHNIRNCDCRMPASTGGLSSTASWMKCSTRGKRLIQACRSRN